IPSLPVRPSGLPAFQRCVLDPQRQAAPPPQARLVGRPVPHLERHLRDVVTAIGVVFVRHREQLEPEREEHPTIPGPAECTNAHQRPGRPHARVVSFRLTPNRVLSVWITIATSTGFRNTPDIPISCSPIEPISASLAVLTIK